MGENIILFLLEEHYYICDMLQHFICNIYENVADTPCLTHSVTPGKSNVTTWQWKYILLNLLVYYNFLFSVSFLYFHLRIVRLLLSFIAQFRSSLGSSFVSLIFVMCFIFIRACSWWLTFGYFWGFISLRYIWLTYISYFSYCSKVAFWIRAFVLFSFSCIDRFCALDLILRFEEKQPVMKQLQKCFHFILLRFEEKQSVLKDFIWSWFELGVDTEEPTDRNRSHFSSTDG